MGKFSQLLEEHMPKVVIAPTFVIMAIFIYGFIAWNFVISLTKSTILPVYKFVGFKQYVKLFANDKWQVALENLLIFSVLFIGVAIILGLLLAIFLDQKIRQEGFFRTVYLYPMALSLIATGTVWKWIMNPDLGLERLMQEWGFNSFSFDWIVNSDMAIFAIIIAAVWQSAGFVMVLLLAGLRGINDEIIKAALVDGAGTLTIYRKIIIPQLAPFVFSAVIILVHLAIKTFDLVVAMTNGGPGYASILPSIFMYEYSFSRNSLAFGAASATVMLLFVMILIIPYLYTQLRKKA